MNHFIVALTSLFIVACASPKVTTESRYSGFLDDYSQLEEVELETGGIGLIWIDPDIDDKGYTKAILEPVVIYPAPTRDSELNLF